MHVRLRFLMALAVGALGAPPVAAQQPVAYIEASPELLALAVGERQRLFGAAFDRGDNIIPASRVRFTFESTDTAVAVVDADGVVVGVRAGRCEVIVRAGGQSRGVPVMVTGDTRTPAAARTDPESPAIPLRVDVAAVRSIAIEPTAARLLPLERLPLTARAALADGTVTTEAPVRWESLNPATATVDATGTVTGGVQPGMVTILAEAGSVRASTQIAVEPVEVALERTATGVEVEGLDTLRLVVPSQRGRVADLRAVWATTDSTVVRVGPTGIIQGLRLGRAEVTAMYLREYRVAVTVHERVSRLQQRPRTDVPLRVPLLGTLPVALVALDSMGAEVAGVPVAWSVADPAVAVYDPEAGVVRGLAPGTTTLTATVRLGGFDPQRWVVQVVPGRVMLDRPRVGLGVGEQVTLRAALADDDGRPIAPADRVAWTSSAPAVATVDADGTVRAVAPGRATVTATTPWERQASAEVFVAGDLIYSSSRGGRIGLWQVRLADPAAARPIAWEGGGAVVQARLSPDRTRLAFAATSGGATPEVWVADADGGNARRLTQGGGAEPVWTPDGQRILFASLRSGTSQLYSVNADGTDLRPLTTGPGGNAQPAVSPDGRSVAFISTRDRGYELYVMDITGEHPRRLTSTREREVFPLWLATGEIVVAQEAIANLASAEVVRIDPSTGARTVLFETRDALQGLAMRPDGTVAVTSEARLVGGRTEYRFLLWPLGSGATPVPLPLQPGEQVQSPSLP